MRSLAFERSARVMSSTRLARESIGANKLAMAEGAPNTQTEKTALKNTGCGAHKHTHGQLKEPGSRFIKCTPQKSKFYTVTRPKATFGWCIKALHPAKGLHPLATSPAIYIRNLDNIHYSCLFSPNFNRSIDNNINH